MHDHLRDEAKEEMLDQSKGESWLGPIMAPLENLEHVAIEINIAIKVLLLEGLDGDELLAVVCVTIFCLVELEVVLDRLAR